MNKARKITFPTVGIIQGSRVWRNSETGVEIIKGKNFKEVGLYYVCAPTGGRSANAADGRRVVAVKTTLAAARRVAASYVVTWREIIADHHATALVEHSSRH